MSLLYMNSLVTDPLMLATDYTPSPFYPSGVGED